MRAAARAFTLSLVGACAGVLALTPAPSRAEAFEAQLAAGASFGFQRRSEYGAGTFSRIYPEILAYGYLGGFLGPVWFRPGLRLAYASEQAEMPQSLRVEERDLAVSGEWGVVYDWYVVPSLALGGGVLSRRISLKTEGLVSAPQNDISRKETLGFLHAQMGVGVPLWRGRVVAEPYYRHTWVKGDARISSLYGLELTFGIL